ncbi:MAG: hypothetical protein GEV08_24545, partial [Acidimicrobiia bacterium]|nr:hypothetical protein [Acidimicrobiia bacterium]
VALAGAVLAAIVATGTGLAVAGATADGPEVPLGPGLVTVEVGVEHSRFSLDDLTVRAGTVVRFVLRNGDPIAHELVVGDEDVHARHSVGTEAAHPPVPGEVAVGPGETGLTVYDFAEPTTLVFACHLPGHVAYGMVGEVAVVP